MKRGDFCSRGICALTLILSFLWIPTTGQLLVPVTAPGATPKPTSSSLGPSSCNYLISRTNGVCMVTTSAVDRQLNAIKDDNFRARLQFMSQNSVLQSQISKIESDDVKLSLRVDGLQRDLQALRSRVSTTAPGAPTGSANINQLRTTLQQSIQGVDNRVTGLAAAYQRDAVSQAQTNAAFQQQLTQLLQDNQQLTINNNRLTQELQRLSTQMQTLATQCAAGCGGSSSPNTAPPTTTTTSTTTASTTTTPATTAPAPTINPARLLKIEQDILNLTSLLQQTQQSTAKNTQDLNNAALELQSHNLRIQKNQQDTNQVYQALQILNTVTVPNMQSSLTTVVRDTATLKTQTAQLQKGQASLLNDTVTTKLDVAQLQRDMKSVQTTQGQHRQAIDELNTNLIGPLQAAYPQLSTVQANVNSILNGGSTSPPPPASTTTKGPIIVPPPLNPSVSGPASSKPPVTPGILVPPTLQPGKK